MKERNSSGPSSELSRRQVLAGLAAGSLAFGPARLALASTGSPARLVIINVKGGLDGLAAVIPYGDPYLSGLRAGLLPSSMIAVNNFFALDPHLKNLGALFGAGQALAVHAVAPIVETRSHFLGQDFLQGGATTLGASGWVNRTVGLLGASSAVQAGLALGASLPITMAGSSPVASWAPDVWTATPSSFANVLQTDCSNDPEIGPVFNTALSDRNFFSAVLSGKSLSKSSALVSAAQVAGYCLASPYGPSVAVIETESFDTHAQQNQGLPPLLADLDAAIGALQTTLGAAWSSTVVMTMTEFGRTAYENGTSGTDHGTGFVVFLAGGPVIGGQVIVEGGWIPLNNLFQGRDVWGTCDFRQIAMSVLFDHLGISSSNQETIFPGSTAAGLVPLSGLVSG